MELFNVFFLYDSKILKERRLELKSDLAAMGQSRGKPGSPMSHKDLVTLHCPLPLPNVFPIGPLSSSLWACEAQPSTRPQSPSDTCIMTISLDSLCCCCYLTFWKQFFGNSFVEIEFTCHNSLISSIQFTGFWHIILLIFEVAVNT